MYDVNYVLLYKVLHANGYLNGRYRNGDELDYEDILSVVTREMRKTGRIRLIDMDELVRLNTERTDDYIDFVKLLKAG